MATDTTIDSLPVTGDGAAEALTATVLVASTPGAEAQTSALFDPLHQAKGSLQLQTEASAELHPLNSSLQSLYSVPSADGRLSRHQYRQLIAQIRHSVSQFAATTPALQLPPSSPQQSNHANTANQIRRYISLLTETSTHTAALAHSIAPIKSADVDRGNTAIHPMPLVSFPQQLQVGAFRRGSSDHPTSSWSLALETLDALCETLETTAKALGLETFSEPSSEATEVPSDTASGSVLTHTLTLGAKILVMDIELHIVKTGTVEGFRPKTKLKLSYATDSVDSQQTRDPRLGAVLERDVELIAEKLFGPVSSSSLQQDRTVVAQTLAKWTTNLNELLVLDDLEARASQAATEGSRTSDLFAAMQGLCSAVARISEAEASSSSSAAALLDRGHGLHKLHETKPFLHSIYAHDPTLKQNYTLSIGVQALDLPVADQTGISTVTPSFPLSLSAQDLLASSSTMDQAQALGSIPSETDREKLVPLHFVVQLSPPVVVTRPTAAKLACICNLQQLTPHNNNHGAPVPASGGATWFEDVLATSWSRRPRQASEDARKSSKCTFTLAQTVESVRSTELQGLVIDCLPLLSNPAPPADAMDESSSPQVGASTLARLLAAIEVLRDEVKVTEIMHSAISSSESEAGTVDGGQGQADDLSLDDVLASASSEDSGKIAVTIAFRTPLHGAVDEAQRSLSLQLVFRALADNGATVNFDASISPSKPTSEVGWLLSAVAESDASGKTASKQARLESSSSEAQSMVAELRDLDSLEDVVVGLLGWAEQQLELRLKKPAASDAAFDALSYEQQNVHAIYETIAPHFSNTRYKPWPLIPAFLSTIPAGSLGADLGCGNGKYLGIRSTLGLPRTTTPTPESESDQESLTRRLGQESLVTIGVDRSSNLIGLARNNFGMMEGANKPALAADQRYHEVAVGDAIESSLRTGVFDYAISIATIHHFSTWQRRRASVQELIRIVAPVQGGSLSAASDGGVGTADARLQGGSGRGRFMIFVWALEQKDEGKRHFQATHPESLKHEREIHDPNHVKSKDRLVSYSGLHTVGQAEADAQVTDVQDVLVPWVLTTAASKKAKPPKACKGSNKLDVAASRDMQATTREVETALSSLTVQTEADETRPARKVGQLDTDGARPVYNRYYHMFRSGELEALVADAAATMPAVHRSSAGVAQRIHVVREAGGWERGNWWGVWRVQWSQP